MNIFRVFFFCMLGHYLSNEGQHCNETCQNKSLTCWPAIKTYDSEKIFESTGINCSYVNGSEANWTNGYDPSYNVRERKCVGFKRVPGEVPCFVSSLPLSNVRRLCNCKDPGNRNLFLSPLNWFIHKEPSMIDFVV